MRSALFGFFTSTALLCCVGCANLPPSTSQQGDDDFKDSLQFSKPPDALCAQYDSWGTCVMPNQPPDPNCMQYMGGACTAPIMPLAPIAEPPPEMPALLQ